MRNLDERMAEIHRRSDGILRRRRQRRRILAACVPLVLCVGIWGMISRQNEKSTAGMEVHENQSLQKPQEQNAESRRDDATPMEIAGNGTDALADLVEQILAETEKRSVMADTEETKRGQQDDLGEILTFSVTMQDGNVMEFMLQGTWLTEKETGCQYELTPAQRTDILAVLEMQETHEKG